MRKIDDAHDAEHEIEADSDQAEIQPEQHAGDERVDQHHGRSLPASGLRSATASWTRIDRLAGGGFVRIDRDELDVAVSSSSSCPSGVNSPIWPPISSSAIGAVERLELVRTG